MRSAALLATAMLSCALAGTVRAATYTVTNTNDSGAGSLRQAMTNANNHAGADTIVFDAAGVFATPRTIDFQVAGMPITGELTLEGPAPAGQRVTLRSTNGRDPLFDVASGAAPVTFRHLTLRDVVCTVAYGGAVNQSSGDTGALTFEDCAFRNCRTDWSGAAIYANGPLTATDCEFTDNFADDFGGAIRSSADVTLTRCTFARNSSATRGGALSCSGWEADGPGSTVEITDCTFTDHFSGEAGAIDAAIGTLLLTRCTFTGNVTSSDGGGVLWGGDQATIRKCTFHLNRAGFRGGGIAARNDFVAPRAALDQCTFHENTAEYGGGLYVDGNTELAHCTVSGNTARVGGGISVAPLKQLNVVHSTITGNESTSTNPVSSGGGGIGAISNSRIFLVNSVVAGNRAPAFPAEQDFNTCELFTLGALIGVLDLTATGAVELNQWGTGDRIGSLAAPADPRLGPLADNGGETLTRAPLAGSPLIDAGIDYETRDWLVGPPYRDQTGGPRFIGTVDFGAVESPHTAVVTNTNDSGAGSLREALTLGAVNVTFDSAVFGTTLQTITLTSGPIVIAADKTITAPDVGVKVSGNSASRVFSITGGHSTFRRVRVIDGAATGDGGGLRILNAGTTVLLQESGASYCTATGRGAGIFVGDGAALAATACTIGDNSADDNGGGLWVGNLATLDLTNSTVSGNRSNQNGGGVFVNGGTTRLVNCTVAANTADSDAGGIAGDGGGLRRAAGSVHVGNSIVADNSDASPGAPDLSGTFVSLGHNLVGKTDGQNTGAGTPFVHGVNGDQTGTIAAPLDARLGAFAQIPAASPTRIHPLLNASPARDAGSADLLTHAAWPSPPGTDQRGQTRIIGDAVDVGAAEWPDTAVVSLVTAEGPASEFSLVTGQFRFLRSYDDGTDLVVNVTIDAAGTVAGSDYALSGAGFASTGPGTFTVTLPTGKTQVKLTLTPTADSFVEGTEQLVLTVVNGPNYRPDPGAGAATASLNLLDDEFVVNTNAGSGPGSLRSAINDANDAGGGTITLPAPLQIPLGGSPLTLSSQITIAGGGSTLDAAGLSRVFEIPGSAAVTIVLQDLVITGGVTPAGEDGGGVRVLGGEVSFVRCAITGNTARKRGGGVFAEHAEVSFENCSLSLNTALDGDGGGLAVASSTSLVAKNTTLGANLSNKDGGGLAVGRSGAVLTNVSIVGNTADADASGAGNAGGVLAGTGAVVVTVNCVVAGNFDTPGNAGSGTIAPDVGGDGSWGSLGNNFIGSNAGAAAAFPAGAPNAGGDSAGTAALPLDPQLLPVPGVWRRYDFAFGSLLRDAGNSLYANGTTDQRGWARRHNDLVDIGAVEMDYLVVTNANPAGPGSLRQATLDANALGHGSIRFDPAFFNVPRTISTGTGGQFLLTVPGSIEGPTVTTNLVTLSAGNSSRVLNLAPPAVAEVALRRLNLADGDTTGHAAADQNGAGIFVGDGVALTLDGCTIRDCNAATTGGGLALAPTASLFALNCTFTNGDATFGGGLSLTGAATLENCTLNHNSAAFDGGAVATADNPAEFRNCTFSSNSADRHGGALANLGTVALMSCTATLNTANADSAGGGSGGGFYSAGGTVAVLNTLVAGNDALAGTSDDLGGAFNSLGHNLVGITTGSTGFTSGLNDDLVGAPAHLGPLQNNGGRTLTHALHAGSAAINAGTATNLGTDQRGFTRPATPDIGAYELSTESYAYWAAHTFPAGAPATGQTDDFDGDGFTNALEFGAGSGATGADSFPKISVTTAGANALFELTASPLAPAGWIKLESSPDLLTWTDVPPGSYPFSGTDPARNVLLFRATVPLATYPRLFARLNRAP